MIHSKALLKNDRVYSISLEGMKLKYLDIAGFRFGIIEDGPVKAVIDPSYQPFLCPCQDAVDPEEDITIIGLHPGKPEGLDKFTEVFRAPDNDQADNKTGLLWTIHDDGKRKAIITTSQQTLKQLANIAIFDKNCKKFDIYFPELTKDSTGESRDPFPFPLAPLILYYVSAHHNAAIIHASGICCQDGTGMLFSAISGTGKSTMAGLWQKTGARVINDDRILIKYNNGSLIMHNTPMPYPDVPKQCVLNKVFLIKQSQENHITRLNGANAVSRLFAQFIQHDYNKNHIEKLMQMAVTVCLNAGIYECAFRPGQDIISLIIEQT